MLDVFSQVNIQPRSYDQTFTMHAYYTELENCQRLKFDSCMQGANPDFEDTHLAYGGVYERFFPIAAT